MGRVAALPASLGRKRMVAREASLRRVDALASFAAGPRGQFRILREAAFCVGDALPALPGDQPLLFRVHRGEASLRFVVFLHGSHVSLPPFQSA